MYVLVLCAVNWCDGNDVDAAVAAVVGGFRSISLSIPRCCFFACATISNQIEMNLEMPLRKSDFFMVFSFGFVENSNTLS